MSRSTARAPGSRRPAEADATAHWSGTFAAAELQRPGGLLIAALVQVAEEQALSLHALARAMGVSFWDISQLRFGLRRPTELDDDFVDGSARLLGVPAHTVQMLAGVLDPQDALQSSALDAQDVVHALRLVEAQPEDVVLDRGLNPQRPLQGLGVDVLTDLHRQYGGNPAVAEALGAELACRPLSKTELLRGALAMPPAGPHAEKNARPAPAIMRCTGCPTRLRIPHLPEPGEIRCPHCGAEYAVHWQATVCVVSLQPLSGTGDDARADGDAGIAAGEDLTETQAWAVLGLPEGSAPEAIDRARRTLLQAYHPDRLGQVSAPLRRLAEDAFKRVNDACELLRAAR